MTGARLVRLSRLIWETQGADLPCPWCHSQTGEDDTCCPVCGHRFG